MVDIDLTTLSGYDNLAAGTYNIGVKAKAANYQDSDLSSTVAFTKLAAPVATASDTTVSWDAITNAESYDVYVDGELYENTTGGYDITVNVTNGTYTGDTSISNTATITITADSGYKLPDTVTVTGASQTWNKDTGTLTLTNPTGAVTVSAVCVADVKETWLLNNSLSLLSGSKTFNINFISNNLHFVRLDTWNETFGSTHLTNVYYIGPEPGTVDDKTVYTGDEGWRLGSVYRTIAFLETPTGELLTWLQSNGTKQ